MTYYGMHAHEITIMNSTLHAWMNSNQGSGRGCDMSVSATSKRKRESESKIERKEFKHCKKE